MTKEAIIAMLTELADELEASVQAEYGEIRYPIEQRRYDRDIEPVQRARAMIAQLQGEGDGVL